MILGKIANCYIGSFDNGMQSYVNDIKSVTLSNSLFKEFMVEKDIIITPDTQYPSEWNYQLILHANYTNKTFNSGNSQFNLYNISDILIKRRIKNTFVWQTIYHKKIEEANDFSFSLYDYYGINNVVYEYALVPVSNNIEGDYIIVECESKFDGSYLVGREKIFNLLLDLKIDKSINAPRSFITGINRKYPTVVKNSISNYASGTVSATLLEMNDECNVNEKDAWKYREEFLDFLYDGNAKFFKSFDNKANYIIEIENGASEDNGEYWNAPTTSFSFVQIGSADSEKDLVYSGLSDLEREWWSI